MKNSLVSIIVPMYNAEKYIQETIESVIKQTYTNWEMIIVDDCSSDNSNEIVNKYIDNDKRIKLIKQPINSGPSKARKTGIDNSSGVYIAFLDSDDIWLENKLEKQIKYMEENDVSITCTSYKISSEDLETIYREFIVPEAITYKTLLKQNYFSCDTVVVNRKKIKEIKFTEYDKHEDYILWLSLMKEIEFAYGLQEPLAIYRLRKESRSTGKLDSTIKIWNIYKKIEKLKITQCIYYTINYVIRGILKYRKVFNIK